MRRGDGRIRRAASRGKSAQGCRGRAGNGMRLRSGPAAFPGPFRRPRLVRSPGRARALGNSSFRSAGVVAGRPHTISRGARRVKVPRPPTAVPAYRFAASAEIIFPSRLVNARHFSVRDSRPLSPRSPRHRLADSVYTHPAHLIDWLCFQK